MIEILSYIIINTSLGIVGDGRGVGSWLDGWLGVGPLFSLFPRLFILAIKNDSFVTDCFEVMSGCIIWEITFKRSLRQLKGSRYEELLSVLTSTFFLQGLYGLSDLETFHLWGVLS